MSEDGIPGKLLRDIRYEPDEGVGDPIEHWARIESGPFHLYYEPIEGLPGIDRCGVKFMAVEWCTNDGEDRFQITLWGVAYFDGVRHLYFGDAPKFYGYLHYPPY